MANIKITSGYNFEGYKITEYYGIFCGEYVLGTGLLSSLSAEIADFLGTHSGKYESKLAEAEYFAIEKLKEAAEGAGGNAIIGLDIDYINFSADIMGVVANGNVVKIKEISGNGRQLQGAGNSENQIAFPIVNYYQRLEFRPFQLLLDKAEGSVKIHIVNFSSKKLSAINVTVIANTIFGTTYEYPDINFVDLHNIGNVTETEEAVLCLEENRLRAIQSFSIKINRYILSEEVHLAEEPYQISNMKLDKLAEFRVLYGDDVVGDFQDNGGHWTCMCGHQNDSDSSECQICKREKDVYVKLYRGKGADWEKILSDLKDLNDCQSILAYMLKAQSEHEFFFSPKIMNEVKKTANMERSYGNMKDSMMDILKKLLYEEA